MFSDIIMYGNTKAQRTYTAATLDHLNSLNGTQYARQQIGAGAAMKQFLLIHFAEPWRKDKVDTDAMAVTLDEANGITDPKLTLKLATAMPATADLKVWVRVDDPLPKPKANFALVKRVYQQSVIASGLSVDLQTLDKKDFYQTIAMANPTTGYITKCTLKLNGTPIHELTREGNIAEMVSMGLNPATSTAASAFAYDLVLDEDDPINSALPTQGQDINLKIEFSQAAAGNVNATIERVGYGWD